MNLAQLIPAEWVQEECKPRHAIMQTVAGAAPAERMTRQRRYRGATRMMVLRGLASYRDGVTSRSTDLVHEIGEDGLDLNTMCAMLYQLLALGHVRREGLPRSYKYAITAAGRKALG